MGGTFGSPLYELLIQFWFFYPFNDGGNNHEGDWEHITVSITPHARLDSVSAQRGLLTAAEVRAILGDEGMLPLDRLRIRNVAYYFHNNVMVLDYLAIEAGETMWRRARNNEGSIHIWEDTRYMDNAVRRRMALAGGRLATHPVAYIGGNNKGTDELLQFWPRFQRSYNRDSHGTYPFPGVWRKVGPLDATEKIFGDVVPRLRLDGSGRPDLSLPWYEMIADDRYLVYRREDIVLLPDWERLEPLVMEEPAIRRRTMSAERIGLALAVFGLIVAAYQVHDARRASQDLRRISDDLGVTTRTLDDVAHARPGRDLLPVPGREPRAVPERLTAAPADAGRAVAEGTVLGAYVFDELKTKEANDEPATRLEAAVILEKVEEKAAAMEEGVRIGAILAPPAVWAVRLARRQRGGAALVAGLLLIFGVGAGGPIVVAAQTDSRLQDYGYRDWLDLYNGRQRLQLWRDQRRESLPTIAPDVAFENVG